MPSQMFTEIMARQKYGLLAVSLTGLFRRVRKIAKSDYQLSHITLSVRPSLRMKQISVQWTDFDETCYLRIFRKSVEKI
jgi:hypothetical protein